MFRILYSLIVMHLHEYIGAGMHAWNCMCVQAQELLKFLNRLQLYTDYIEGVHFVTIYM